MGTSLYLLTEQFMQLLHMADEEMFDQQIIKDTLEGVEGEIEEKADSYVKVMKSLEGDVVCIDAEIERLKTRKKTLVNNIDAMKTNLEGAMMLTGKTKFKTTLFSYNIQKNAPSLEVLDETMVPTKFLIPQEPKLDRVAMLKYIKENGEQSWGRTKQTESLRIR